MTPIPDPSRPRFCGRCAAPLDEREDGGVNRPVCAACGWVYYAKNAVGAGVLLTDGDRVLLVQRRDEPYQAQWQLPAGFVEYGERPDETAAREALEEVGLRVRLTGLAGVYFVGDDPRTAGILLVYRATVTGGKLQAGDDAQTAAFFPRGALPQIAFQAQREALRDWQASGK